MASFAQPLRSSTIEARLPAKGPRIGSPAKLLHAALLATAFLVFGWRVALSSGLVAGAAGAVSGALIAERLIAVRYRLYAILIGSAVLVLVGVLVTHFLLGAESIATLLTPIATLHAGEAIRWSSVAFGASLALRAISLRYRAALALEGGVVVLAVATTVAAHRDGMIARPLEISDWFWTQGIDPVLAFLMVGLCGAVLFAGILAYGRSPKRTLVQLFLVLILGLVLALRIHGADVDRPKKNPSGSELNADKDNRNGTKDNGGAGGKGGQDQSGGQSGSPKDDPLPNAGSSQKNRPAAVVIFHKDVLPATHTFYFRHAAFSQYNGVRLIESTRGDVDQDAVRSFPAARQEVPGVKLGIPGRTLVATDVALLTDHSRMFALIDAVEVGPMPNPEPARFRRAYHVVSSVITESYQDLLGSTSGDPNWSDEIWDHYTQLPKDDRYRRLAKELKGMLRSDYADDPVASAMAIKRYLEEKSTYSFARNYDGAEDPTAAFLFSDDMRGYCVHLAHAEVFLLRALGIPARVSAGYAVPAANLGGGSSLLIKSGDAHAWAEIYLNTMGWVPIEVTPEKTDVKPPAFAEKDLQQLLGEMARKEGRDRRQAYQGPTIMDAIRQLMAVLPKVLLAVLALTYALKLWRLIAPRFARKERLPRVAYRAALDRLSAIGMIRKNGEPRERFARRAEGLSPSFAPLTHQHVRFALGSPDSRQAIAGDDRRHLPDLSARVGSEVRKRVAWWHWILGALNPISWIWSR